MPRAKSIKLNPNTGGGGCGDWANLPADLCVAIAESIQHYRDFVRFGVVCKPWRSVATLNNFKGRDYTWWLMESPNGLYTDDRSFTPTSTTDSRTTMHLQLPEANGRRCFETLGWLVTVDEDGEMNLLHPFSRAQFPLPNVSTFMFYDRKRHDYSGYIQRAVLSSSPSRTADYVVMVIFVDDNLGFWKPGNPIWSHIEPDDFAGFFNWPYRDVVYYKNQFYAIGVGGHVVLCDVWGPQPAQLRLVGEAPITRRSYLVQSGSELLLVTRGERGNEFSRKYKFNVFVINISSSSSHNNVTFSVVEKKSLENMALFIGHSASISVDSTKMCGGVKRNCIYHICDFEDEGFRFSSYGQKEVGIYHMEDATWEVLYERKFSSTIGQPLWITPCP